MTLNCIIIDDEPLAAELLASYAKKVPFLTLQGTFNSATEAIKTIREMKIDLIFLDIQMPELSGLEFARIIGPETNLAQIAVSSAVLGFGIGMSMPLGNIAAQTGAEPHNIGKATSMALFFRGLGGTIGTAACGAAVGASSVGAAPAVFGICIALAATCLVTMVWLPKMIEGRRGARGRAHAAGGADGARGANGDASVRITDISCERPAAQGAEGEIAPGNPRPKPASPNVVP